MPPRCLCTWDDGGVVTLCAPHIEAFHLRADTRQVEAVRARLRESGGPELGDILYDALGAPIVRVTGVVNHTDRHVMLNDYGLSQSYGTRRASTTIEGVVIDPVTRRMI